MFSIRLGDIAKKLADIQTKLSPPDETKRKQEDLLGNLAKQQAPLIDEIKRLTPILDKLKQQQQKDSENLNLLKNIDSKLNQLTQNIGKDDEAKNRTQPIQQALDTLSKQQQPLLETVRELPKKLDEIRQAQIPSDFIKQFKAMKDGFISTRISFHFDSPILSRS